MASLEIGETLKMLSGIKTVKISIGTGNCFTGLNIKLSHVELLNFFDLDDTFYASEINWSRELIMEQAFKSLDLDQVGIVIGDSPRDIEVAKKSHHTGIPARLVLHQVRSQVPPAARTTSGQRTV